MTNQPSARHVLPELTERTPEGTVSRDPYSKLLAENIVMIGAPIDAMLANDVVAQLMHLEHARPERDIEVYLNTPGGSPSAILTIHDAMEYVRPDILTVCLGEAGGASGLLLAAGAPGKRMMLPGARVHLVPLSGEFQGQASDLERGAAELLRTAAQVEQLLARHTGRDVETVHRELDRERYYSAEEAIGLGYADRVSTSRKGRVPPRIGIR
jgi:ATP-dependent Clp protease protease subunit